MERSPLSAWAATKYFIFMTGVIGGLLLSGKSARAQVTAKFKADHTTGCGQLSVQFTDESAGNPSAWHWDFGNGQTSNKQNPSTNYTQPGTYTVTLRASNGVSSGSATSIIYVYEQPEADFTLDSASGCYPLSVLFTDNSSPGTGNITKWTWDFGDGSRFSDEQNPTHVYDSAGTFDVKLEVTNSAGCSASSPPKQVVTNKGVTVNFTADKTFSCSAPFTVNFTASTSSPESITYQWDFGDGGHAAGKTASHTYTAEGKFVVTLTAAVNGGGCRDQVVKKDYIYVGNYTADFEIPQGCANVPLSFKNTSTPKPVSAAWDFGDGGTSSDLNPKHTYSAAGTYTVTLTSDFGGCTQKVQKTLTTYSAPKAAFKADPQQYCGIPASVTFQNLSTGAAGWKWRFGDGDSSTAQQAQHDYKSGGDYDVTLIATSDKGCVDSAHKAGYIHVDAPDIDFKASPGFGCVGLAPTFSVPDAADIASYQWDFGDGSTSTAANPTHPYNKQDAYTVTLSVVTKSGCSFSKSKADYIHIGKRPNADFTADPPETCLDKKVQFTNTSSPAGDYWLWEFPKDGKNSTDTAENPLHKFTTLGSQDVTLIVSNNGCSDTAFKPGIVTVKPPKAAFDAKVASCDQPLTYQFTDKSTPIQGITSWKWDFGDGTQSTERNPKHTYSGSGGRKVVLTVSNGSCSASDSTGIQVEKEKPVLTVSAGKVCHGSKVTLSVGEFGIAQYVKKLEWFDGAGHSVTTTDISKDGNEHAFTYKGNGTFTPALKLTYITKCTDSVAGDPVNVQGPVAGFTASQNTLCQGTQVTFTDNSKLNPANVPIKQWEWDYQDGTGDTTTTGTVTHSFLKSGAFPVRLKVTDANGCTDESPKSPTNVINVNPSRASFDALDTTVCPGVPMQWEDKSEGHITSYLWDLGDGSTSSAAVPQNKYAKDGIYTVSLKITTDKGCSDSMTRENYITVGTPEAVIKNPGNVKICRILKDTAISLSKNYDNILWDFGDGTTSSGDTAYHIYNIPGTYTQKLIVNGYSPGCTAEAKKQVIIAGPIGTPVLANTTGCTPLTVNFSAKDVKRAVSYQWYFGDGSISQIMSGPDATYTYKHEGSFHPTLKLTDDTGCYVIVPITDTLTVVADSIGLQPTYSWPEVCDSNTVKFKAEGVVFSIDSLGKKADYFWDFGDPANRTQGVSNEKTPEYRYPASGTYHALLRVTTQYGCTRSVPFDVTVPDSVQLKTTATADIGAICAGKSVQLSASSNIGERYVWSPAQGLNTTEGAHVTATPPSTTTYRVIAFSHGNCQSDTADVNIVVHALPGVDAGPDQTAATGSVVQLQATGSTDVVQWKWTPSDYLNCTDCAAPVSTPRRPITYTVTGTTGFGCSDSSSVTIHLVCDEGKVFIPNTFTPNNDGKNDVFYPRGRGVKTVLYFQIYNRFGQLVYERTNFELNDQSAGWDGTFKGTKLNPGVFVYAAEMVCDDNKIFKLSGNVTLLR